MKSETAKSNWRADRNNELSDLLRRKIVDAARDCLKESGYAKLRMDKVAKQAGCSRGTLYRYFASKDEILLSIALSNFLRIAETVEKELDQISDPRLMFATGLARSMAIAQSTQMDFILNIDITMVTQSQALSDVIANKLAPYMTAAKSMGTLSEGINLEDATHWIIQASVGLLSTGWPAVGGRVLKAEEQVDYLCQFLLLPVFAPQEEH